MAYQQHPHPSQYSPSTHAGPSAVPPGPPMPPTRPHPYAHSPAPRSYTTPLPVVPQGGFPTPSKLVEKIPLIKSPSFWVPKPVQLPPDIHPLPEDITAYFVYPHTLEAHALGTLPAKLAKLRQARSQHLHLLASMAESKEKARRAALNKLAPGYDGASVVMEPIRRETGPPGRGSRSARRKKTDETTAAAVDEEEDWTRGSKMRPRSSGDDLMLASPTESDGLGVDSTLDAAESAHLKALVEGLEAMDAKRSRKQSSLIDSYGSGWNV